MTQCKGWVDMNEGNSKSVYRVLSVYLDHAKKFGNYIKGYIDEKDKLEMFLKEYTISSQTKFIIRSSCKKAKDFSSNETGNATNCTRYGRADRIYWEFNNRNLVVPFTGTPFITKSSQIKHCEHGAQYYKLKADKLNSQDCTQKGVDTDDAFSNILQQTSYDQSTPQPHHMQNPAVLKRRRMKPSKKRNCPAYMYIREVVLFPEYALSPEFYNASKHILRKEKSSIIVRLKEAMIVGSLKTIHRFFVNIPLPEAHADHPLDASVCSIRSMDPFVRSKIDELLLMGVYEVRHIQLIINDHVHETLMKNGLINYPEHVLYPSEQEINDYVYLSSISEPTVVELLANDQSNMEGRSQVPDGVEESINELTSLLESCKDEETLQKVKKQMNRIIQRVKQASNQQKHRKRTMPQYDHSSKKAKTVDNFTQNASSGSMSTTPQQPLVVSASIPDEITLTPVATEDLSNVNILQPSLPHVPDVHITTFSRLMESDQAVLPSLVERVIGGEAHFHGNGITIQQDLSNLNHLQHDGTLR
ncbi:uncharacterized protein LOC143457470 isoform X2 [Clavelina lepadiformis]|uniref:uncharacterized protein LOC143457470 isoform X2 n=1 Tax=Clavelina lepadiformis TaxID=159417 RepID=UPI004041C325